MNYIQHLQCQVVDLNDQHLRRADRFAEFRAHLASSKFGPQADGERGDLISVADVQRWLTYIEDIGQNNL
jgi:predicted TPR repeat methyltransferase